MRKCKAVVDVGDACHLKGLMLDEPQFLTVDRNETVDFEWWGSMNDGKNRCSNSICMLTHKGRDLVVLFAQDSIFA